MSNRAKLLLVLLALGAGFPRARALGAGELPPCALARLGSDRFYHGPWIGCAVLSPDGSRIASAAEAVSSRRLTDKERNAYDTLIVLWDAATGERVRELHAPHRPVSHLLFSPDGKRLAAECGGDDKEWVVVFEVKTGKLLRQLGSFKGLGYLQFSADGKQLRVSEWCGPVTAWDAATGKQLRRWKPPPAVPPRKGKDSVGAVRGVLSPDGKVIVWEMGTATRSRDGATTSVGRDAAGLRVHDAETNKRLDEKKLKLFDPPARLRQLPSLRQGLLHDRAVR
jgi:WD40 repeat protein